MKSVSFFNNQLFRGESLNKYVLIRFNAFGSPNFPVLLESGIQIKVHSDHVMPPENNQLKIHPIQSHAIHLLSLYPRMPISLLQASLTHLSAL